MLADYFEELVGHKFPDEHILSYYVGIGNTDKVRHKYEKIDATPEKANTKNRTICRRGPGGLHHKILSAIDGRDASYLNSAIIPKSFRHIFHSVKGNLKTLIEAYIRNDRQAMLEALPVSIRVKYDHDITSNRQAMAELPLDERIKYVPDTIKEFNVPDGISADDLNRIGKWLTELWEASNPMHLNTRPPYQSKKVGEWLQETFPAKEQSLQNTVISAAIKDAHSHKK